MTDTIHNPVMRADNSDLMYIKGYFDSVITDTQLQMRPPVFQNYYDIVKSTRELERFATRSGLGKMGKIQEGRTQIFYDSNIQGPKTELTPDSYELFESITRENWDDDQLGELRKWGVDFAESAQDTKDWLAAFNINGGFDVVKSPDGQYLFDSAHVLLGGGTYNNRATTDADLDVTSLRQAITEFMSTPDERGKKRKIYPKYLMVPTSLLLDAQEILKSSDRPDTPNRAVNVAAMQGLEILENPYLSGDGWYLIWDKVSQDVHPLKMINRVELETGIDLEFDRHNAPLLRAYMRCLYGVTGWRGIFGNPGKNA